MIHTAKKQVEITKSSPRVLAMALGFNPEQDSPTHKKGQWEDDKIGFTTEDLEGIVQPHEDALVVTLQIGGF